MPAPGTMNAVFGNPTGTTLVLEVGFPTDAPASMKGRSWFNQSNGSATPKSRVIAMHLDSSFQQFQAQQANICMPASTADPSNHPGEK